MKKIKNQVRQGDVLINPVASVPPDLKPVPRESGKVILAHGEVTGHHHALLEPEVQMLRGDTDAERFLSVGKSAKLTHQEHATIPVLPTAKATPRHVVRQREFSDDLSTRVAD
jgi:hypothetical protein